MTKSHEDQLPELIALTGLDGTGKGHLAQHLREEHGFLALGASEIIKRVKSERPHLRYLHPDEATRRLKEELGSTFITDAAVEQFEANRDLHTGLVLMDHGDYLKSKDSKSSVVRCSMSMQIQKRDLND